MKIPAEAQPFRGEQATGLVCAPGQSGGGRRTPRTLRAHEDVLKRASPSAFAARQSAAPTRRRLALLSVANPYPIYSNMISDIYPTTRFCSILIIVFVANIGFSAEPRATFNVRDFGAVGDGTNKDTAAFQKALDACAVGGGGEVIVPVGNYLIGSVQMGYATILRLETNSVIIGSGDASDYPTLDIRWEGRWQPGWRALIYAANVDHTGIIVTGRIEGNRAMAAPQNPRGALVWNRLRAMTCIGKVSPSRRAAIGPRTRPIVRMCSSKM